MPLTARVRQQIAHLGALIINIIVPTILQILQALYIKEPYHTSILSGEGWVQELLHGHPRCIQCELGVTKNVFEQLIVEIHAMDYMRSKYVFSEEQLAIFLYMVVTGLTIWHVGGHFQQSNETISK